jgi:hypothetical protein
MDPQNARPVSRVSEIVSRATLVADIILLTWFAYFAAYPRAKLRQLFVELDVELPVVTQWLVGTSTTLWLVGLVGLGAVLILKELLIRDALVKLTINLAIALVLLIFASVAVFAIFEPLSNLLDSLS